jgi:hypothetical protein
MTGPGRRALRAAVWMAALAALALLSSGPASDGGHLFGYGAYPVSGARPAAGESAVFYISGGVSDFYPGQTQNLVLTVTNPQGFGITVTTLSIWVNAPTGSTCATSYLSAPSSVTVNLQIPAGGAVQTTVPVTLLMSAPDACQGAAFALVYGGTAVRT